jgi:hypothetical protein
MWFDGEKESFNAAFAWTNILVKGKSITVQYYKSIIFAGIIC